MAAGILDLAVQMLLALLTIQSIELVAGALGATGIGIGSVITALGLVILFLIVFAYGIVFEMVWGGRTPGKRLMGLRVVREGGLPVTLTSSGIRNVLRFIDFGLIPLSPPIVLFGMPGFLSIFFSPSSKRIGDYAAGTLVIVEASGSPLGARSAVHSDDARVSALLPWIRNVDRVTAAEYRNLRRFVSRRSEMDLAAQASLGELLARPLLVRLELNLVIQYQLQFADVAAAIERCCAERYGLL
jgi:uncharacterized RDD family membrane protein YckC